MRFFKGPAEEISSLGTFRGSAHLRLLREDIGVTLTSTLSSLASVGEWMSSSISRSSSSPPEQKPASRSVVEALVPARAEINSLGYYTLAAIIYSITNITHIQQLYILLLQSLAVKVQLIRIVFCCCLISYK